MASELPASQLGQVKDALGQADLAADLWFAADSHALTEVDVTATPKAGTNASAQPSAGDKLSLVLLISTPKDASALAAPTNYSELPLAPIIQSLMQSFGQGLLTAP